MTPNVSEHALVRLSLRRPVTMMMVLLSMLVLGAVALASIPLELVPSGFSPPFLMVSATYPDATARDIEDRITRPLEQAVATTPGLDRIDATSHAGSASLMLLFKSDVDMNVAYRQVRDRIARVRGDLPGEVNRVEIRKDSGESLPVAFYGVSWERELADPHGVIDRQILRPLERIDGVALVHTFGREDAEIRIDIDRGLADAAGLDVVQVAQRLATSNFTLASGKVVHESGTYLVRSIATWTTLGEIEGLVVGPNDLRLADIATVTHGRPPLTRHDRFRGRPSLIVAVFKESQANTVAVSDRIKTVMDAARSDPALQGMSIEAVFVQGDTIRFSLQQVLDSGVQGGALAILVLALFLRRLRLTVMIALSIPLSLFLALPVMHFTGQTINLVSLVGLMICIGLVVDNSVVVAENVIRYRRRGLGPLAAALHGASEVGLAITLATLTTVIVFLPASLLAKGVTQFLMVRMVTPVCVSLVASLFVALVLIPLASAAMLGDTSPTPGRARGPWAPVRVLDRGWKRVAEAIYRCTFDPLGRAYTRLLRVVLRRRLDVALVSVLALASTIVPAMHVRCDDGENFGRRHATVHYAMPSDTTLEEADAFFRGIEALLDEIGAEHGVDGAYVGFDADEGEVQMFFGPPRPGDPPFERVATALAGRLPEPPGWRKRSRFGDSDGARDDSFHVAIYGDDHEQVQAARDDLEQQLVRIAGVVGIRKHGDRRREQLALTVERAMTERFGVPATTVANTVAYAIRGTPLPRFAGERQQIDVRLRYREEDRRTVDQLLDYRVPTRTGAPIPIAVLADRHVQPGDTVLSRNNKRAGTVIRLDLDPDTRPDTMRRITAFVERYQLPEGLSFDAELQSRELEDMQRDLGGAMLLGSIFVFLLMGFLFESLVLPLSVLPSIPLSFVGVWWFLYLTNESIDALAGIGIVLLLGVVVNNGIVLVDFVNQARMAGKDRTEAIVAAGLLRFRPIMMTTLTTIGGMLPLAFSEPTGEGIPYGPFGKALVGGMTTATILTLVVVPVAYAALDDLRTSASAWWQRLVHIVRNPD